MTSYKVLRKCGVQSAQDVVGKNTSQQHKAQSSVAEQPQTLQQDQATTMSEQSSRAQPVLQSQRDLSLSQGQIIQFQQFIFSQGDRLYRDLPWRNTYDPYEIWLSEVMLQQTQVARVIHKWTAWLKRFPTVDALAAASSADVLEEWQGLGYNRRALSLKKAAEAISNNFSGIVPSDYDQLIALPGIGPATASGIRAFAYELPGIYLETNVRTVYIHEFFPQVEKVHDKDVLTLMQQTTPKHDVRRWYYAMLDYGAHLKATIPNPSRRSRHYAKQSKFEGSHRQKRSFVVRLVLEATTSFSQRGLTFEEIARLLNEHEAAKGREELSNSQIETLLNELVLEGFMRCEDGIYQS